MISIDNAVQLVMKLDSVTEEPHFETRSFRAGKKIFATLNEKNKEMVLKFTELEQEIFLNYNPDIFRAVNGYWGKKGWTIMDLSRVDENAFQDAVKAAYQIVNR
ncbi:MAG: MmcQ/YjbR family DNA-binding protein [Calditrichaeota bacterium]|nr:MmcQ/YjbR family DNA-binding protein [Calditrichota bacterium]